MRVEELLRIQLEGQLARGLNESKVDSFLLVPIGQLFDRETSSPPNMKSAGNQSDIRRIVIDANHRLAAIQTKEEIVSHEDRLIHVPVIIFIISCDDFECLWKLAKLLNYKDNFDVKTLMPTALPDSRCFSDVADEIVTSTFKSEALRTSGKFSRIETLQFVLAEIRYRLNDESLEKLRKAKSNKSVLHQILKVEGLMNVSEGKDSVRLIISIATMQPFTQNMLLKYFDRVPKGQHCHEAVNQSSQVDDVQTSVITERRGLEMISAEQFKMDLKEVRKGKKSEERSLYVE